MGILLYLCITLSTQKDAGRGMWPEEGSPCAPLLLSAENWADGSPNLSGMFHICKTKTVITAGLSDCGNQ